MDVSVDRVTITLSIHRSPIEPPSTTWTFTAEPDTPFKIDERELETALTEAVSAAGGINTMSLDRTFHTGGWGATGLTTLDVVIALAENIAATILVDSIRAIYKKATGRPAAVSEEKRAVASAAAPRSPKRRPAKPTRRETRKKRNRAKR